MRDMYFFCIFFGATFAKTRAIRLIAKCDTRDEYFFARDIHFFGATFATMRDIRLIAAN